MGSPLGPPGLVGHRPTVKQKDSKALSALRVGCTRVRRPSSIRTIPSAPEILRICRNAARGLYRRSGIGALAPHPALKVTIKLRKVYGAHGGLSREIERCRPGSLAPAVL